MVAIGGGDSSESGAMGLATAVRAALGGKAALLSPECAACRDRAEPRLSPWVTACHTPCSDQQNLQPESCQQHRPTNTPCLSGGAARCWATPPAASRAQRGKKSDQLCPSVIKLLFYCLVVARR